MAKRKRQPGEGAKLHPIKDYHSDHYTPYIFHGEVGILEAWTMEPDLRDGEVRQTLRGLIKTMQRTGQLPLALTGAEDDTPQTVLESCILNRLFEAFAEFGPLTIEETSGILGVINSSVGTWNQGMQGQEYLKYLKEFLASLGVEFEEAIEEDDDDLEFESPFFIDLDDDGLDDHNPDDDDSIEGEYHEIKSA